MITENISTLKMHKLTQEQYNRERYAGNLQDNEIYLTPIEELDVRDISDDFVVESSECFDTISVEVKQYDKVVSGCIRVQIDYDLAENEELCYLINAKYAATHQVFCPVFWDDGQLNNCCSTINGNNISFNLTNAVSGVAQFSFCYLCI